MSPLSSVNVVADAPMVTGSATPFLTVPAGTFTGGQTATIQYGLSAGTLQRLAASTTFGNQNSAFEDLGTVTLQLTVGGAVVDTQTISRDFAANTAGAFSDLASAFSTSYVVPVDGRSAALAVGLNMTIGDVGYGPTGAVLGTSTLSTRSLAGTLSVPEPALLGLAGLAALLVRRPKGRGGRTG